MRYDGPANRSSLFLLPLLLFWLTACATTQDTGVRKDFEQRQIQSVAIVPFYARSSFGMEREQFAATREIYEAVTTAALRDLGFEVVDPRAFRQHLVELELWSEFSDGVYLRQPLTRYFEPTGSSSLPIEVSTLRALAEDERFPFDTLLVGEIVYQTRGDCRDNPEKFTSYARTTVLSGAPQHFPRPCVSSHFQAKLVDVQTGHTMWFNRMYFETHARQIDDELVLRNITHTIQAAFTDSGGLTPLAPRRPRTPTKQTAASP